MAWPEGMPLEVACEFVAHTATRDACIDGSFWQESSEALPGWIAWFDSLKPVFTGAELENLEAELRLGREEQKALLPR